MCNIKLKSLILLLHVCVIIIKFIFVQIIWFFRNIIEI